MHGSRSSNRMLLLLISVCVSLPGLGFAETAGWETWEPQEVVWLMKSLSGNDVDVVAARKMVAASFYERFLQPTAVARQVPANLWGDALAGCASDLAEQETAAWAAGIKAILEGTDQLAACKDALPYVAALDRLQDRDAGAVLCSWVQASENWKAFSGGRLLGLTQRLKTTGAQGAVARYRVGRFLANERTGNIEQTRSTPLVAWEYHARALRGDLAAEDRRTITDAIAEAYAPSPEAVEALGQDERGRLIRTFLELGDARGSAWAADILNNADKRKSLSAVESAWMASWASEMSNGLKKESLQDLEVKWQAAHTAGKFSWEACTRAGWAWRTVDADACQGWAQRAYAKAFGSTESASSAGPGAIADVSNLLFQSGLTGPGKGHLALAGRIRDLAKQTDLRQLPYFDARTWAAPLGDAGSRAVVKEALLDSHGLPRLSVTLVLAHAAELSGTGKEWSQTIQEKQDSANISGDARALWIVAGLQHDLVKGTRSGLADRRLVLERAYAGATGEAVRLELIRELANAYASAHAYRAAVSALESVKGQFSEPNRQTLTSISESLRLRAEGHASEVERERAQRERSNLLGRLRYYQKRLRLAQASADTNAAEKAQRLQAAIRKIESQLNSE